MIKVGNKELDELREKAEAFDFLSERESIQSFVQHCPSPNQEYMLIDHMGFSIYGETLLDCVKKARECEG